jgi:serine/threonine protein kinase
LQVYWPLLLDTTQIRWQVGLDICSALKDLHALGIIHRDIKPSNVVRQEVSLGKRGSGVKTASNRHRQRKGPVQAVYSTANMSLGSQQISLNLGSQHTSQSTFLTAEMDSNAQPQQSNKPVYGSFRSIIPMIFGSHENNKNGKTSPLSNSETVGSLSTHRSYSSAAGQSTFTASQEIKLAGQSSAALQSCYSEQGQAIFSSNNLLHETAETRVPSAEKHAKQYSYILIDLGSAIGKQEAAEDAGANLSLALQTFSENAFVGTPAYASPETFVQQASLKIECITCTNFGFNSIIFNAITKW